jgi:hypothetical protein
LASVFLLDGLANVDHRRTGGMHLHRVTRDVKADASSAAVLVPRHLSVGCTRLHEAVFVVAMSIVLAPAEARHLPQHFGMPGRELIRGEHDIGRAGRREGAEGKRRENFRRRWRWMLP